MSNEISDPEMANNTVVAGALWALLNSDGVAAAVQHATPAYESDGDPNQVDIELTFMESPYRITVERLDRPKQSATS